MCKEITPEHQECLDLIKFMLDSRTFLMIDHPDEYWQARKLLELRICSLRHCSGDGIIGDGWGDFYYCDCMTPTERHADQERIELENSKNGG